MTSPSFIGTHPRCGKCGDFKAFDNGQFGSMVEYCPRCDPRPSPFTIVRSSGPSRPNRPALALPIETISGGNNPSGLPRRRAIALTPTREESPMPKMYKKKCGRSGRAFESPGPAARFCGVCAECKEASPGKPKPRPTVRTGFVSQPPSSGSPYHDTIAKMRLELDELEARRIVLVDAIAAMEKLGA